MTAPSPGGLGRGAKTDPLSLRDQALAALDEGDTSAALAIAEQGRAALEQPGLRGGDAAALLVALAEIEEALGRFDEARVTIAAAIVTLEGGDDLREPRGPARR